MPYGLEDFIKERHDEGNAFVVIDESGGCFGWGQTIDAAWVSAEQNCAAWVEQHSDLEPEDGTARMLGSECYHSEPDGKAIETYADWKLRKEG
jgi:hypothetical protein